MEIRKGKIQILLVLLLLTATFFSVPANILVARADPVVTRFRLLAVERYFDSIRMREGEDLILELLNYQNWDNSTGSYVSYIHLLSAISDPANLDDDVEPFYRGNSTKANLQYEIENFLAQAGDEEIVILYYVGHSGTCYMSLDYAVSEAELDTWMSSIDSDAYVNMILDTCHSGCWIHDGVGPNELDHADNVLAACHQDQSAWCWGCYTAFTDEGLLPGFGSATDTNGDGWASLNELFDYARPRTISYASSKGKTQEPESWYGVCTGNIPIVQRDPTEPFPDFAYPTSSLFIGLPKYLDVDTYVTSSSSFTLIAEDSTCPSSDVDFIKYKIDTGSWVTYTSPFTLPAILSDGPHTVYFYSQDNAGNVEPTNSETVILDNTPPIVEVVAPPDGYIYGQITIQIDATDDGSGVDYVEYSLDESTWVSTTYNSGTGYYEADWDTALIPDGDYTVYARAFDNLGNKGHDPEPPEVTVVHLELSTSFSDSSFNPIEEFDAVFSAQKPPKYKLSTNPGTIYEIIEITNTGSTVTSPSLELDVSIPIEADFLGVGKKAFKTQGAKYVHIYLNGEDVTPKGKWQPALDALVIDQDLSPSDTITIMIHYEYAFKGNQYDATDVMGWSGENYNFETIITNAFGPSWTETISAIPVIM